MGDGESPSFDGTSSSPLAPESRSPPRGLSANSWLRGFAQTGLDNPRTRASATTKNAKRFMCMPPTTEPNPHPTAPIEWRRDEHWRIKDPSTTWATGQDSNPQPGLIQWKRMVIMTSLPGTYRQPAHANACLRTGIGGSLTYRDEECRLGPAALGVRSQSASSQA